MNENGWSFAFDDPSSVHPIILTRPALAARFEIGIYPETGTAVVDSLAMAPRISSRTAAILVIRHRQLSEDLINFQSALPMR